MRNPSSALPWTQGLMLNFPIFFLLIFRDPYLSILRLWLVFCSCVLVLCLSKGLNTYISQYDNMRLGDLNFESSDLVLNDYSNVYNLFSLVKEPTCFKNPYNQSCIDFFLTNRPRGFQNTFTIETGISDIHKMVITVMIFF